MNTKLVSSQKDISDYFPKSIMLKTTKTEKFGLYIITFLFALGKLFCGLANYFYGLLSDFYEF